MLIGSPFHGIWGSSHSTDVRRVANYVVTFRDPEEEELTLRETDPEGRRQIVFAAYKQQHTSCIQQRRLPFSLVDTVGKSRNGHIAF